MSKSKLVYNPRLRKWGRWITYRGKRIFVPAEETESKVASLAKTLAAGVVGAGIGAGAVVWLIQRRISRLPSPARRLVLRFLFPQLKTLKSRVPKGLVPKELLDKVRIFDASSKWKSLLGPFPVLSRLKVIPLTWKGRLYLFYRDPKAVPREVGRFIWRQMGSAKRKKFLPLIQSVIRSTKHSRLLEKFAKSVKDPEEVFADAYAEACKGVTREGVKYKKDIFEKLADMVKREFKVEVSWSAD